MKITKTVIAAVTYLVPTVYYALLCIDIYFLVMTIIL